jgi:uncharacterized protein with PIN domain
MYEATFYFYGALDYFLHASQRGQPIAYRFDQRNSVKDAVEAIGPPHPEVKLLMVNGVSVGWEYVVQPDDEIHVYDDFTAVSVGASIRLIPPYPGRPRFILDTHLGKLTGYLRMLGFDTLYRNDYPDDELARVSAEETRILLTRDLGVLKRGIVTYGYFVRETAPRLRLQEINQRYELVEHAQPFKHCLRCNGLLHPVPKQAVLDHVPPDVVQYYEVFHQCDDCQQIYWKGSHYQKMERMIAEIMQK